MQTLVGTASRSEGAGPAARERSANDRSRGSAPSFDGVLADVTADNRRARTDRKPDASGFSPTDQTRVLPFQQKGTAVTDDDPFLDEVFEAAQPDQSAKDVSGEPDAAGLTQEARAPSQRKDEAGGDLPATLSAPPDLLAMLLVGQGAASRTAAAPQTAPGSSSSPTTGADPTSATIPAALPSLAKLAVATPSQGTIASGPRTPAGPLLPADVESPASTAGDLQRPTPASAQAATIVSAAPTFETHLAPARSMPESDAASSVSEPGSPLEPRKSASTIEPTALEPPSAVEKDADISLAPRRDSAPVTSGVIAVLPKALVSNAISGAIVEMASRAAPTSAEQPAPIVTPMARSMVLQLSPADLGTVDIRMHMSGDTLDVELTLSDTRTYGLVSRERDDLTAALHDTNYSLNSLVIQESGAASSGGFHGNSAHSSAGGEPRSDRFAGDSDAGQRDRGGGQDQGKGSFEQGRSRASAPTDRTNAGDRRAGSLFV